MIVRTCMLMTTCCAAWLSSAGWALAEEVRENLIETTAEQVAADRGYEIVGSVRSIRQYRGTGWQYVNDETLILSVDASRDYLVELVAPCRGLDFAERIAATTTGTELTTFDSIFAPDGPGGGRRCPIRAIHRLKRLPPPSDAE